MTSDTVKFILLATQRSGSTWVIDMLNSHPQVKAYSELFLEDGRGAPTWGGAKDCHFWNDFVASREQSTNGRQELIEEYLDRVLDAEAHIRAVGLKLMYGQAGAFPEVRHYVALRGLKVVHLVRGNLLDIVLSKEAAVARDRFHARKGDDVPAARLRLNPATLVSRLQWEAAQRNQAATCFRKITPEYMEITYEELRHDDGCFRVILEFLGIDAEPARLRSSLRQMNTASQRDLISNYGEVAAQLDGSPFRDMLH